MAKKPSNPRRKPVPAKRRRRALPERREHVEAKGTFAGTAFQSDAFQTDVAKADQRAAPIAARTGEVASGRAQLTLTPKPVTVVPTPYPSDPAAPLPVHGYLRVDVASPAFKEFDAKLEQIFAELQRSNIIVGETRDRLSAELEAGRTLLVAPKPSRDLVDLRLIMPLKYLATAAVGAVLGMLAQDALAFLVKLISHAPDIPI
jgi:hypothetical protein